MGAIVEFGGECGDAGGRGDRDPEAGGAAVEHARDHGLADAGASGDFSLAGHAGTDGGVQIVASSSVEDMTILLPADPRLRGRWGSDG